jgi:ATP-dependent Clp protease ATP-binding subunit ClpC
VRPGGKTASRPPPYTSRPKIVLERSLGETLHHGHSNIRPKYILLALIREGEGVAAQVLTTLGAVQPKVRPQVIALANRLSFPDGTVGMG